jgi:hypothetical protein
MMGLARLPHLRPTHNMVHGSCWHDLMDNGHGWQGLVNNGLDRSRVGLNHVRPQAARLSLFGHIYLYTSDVLTHAVSDTRKMTTRAGGAIRCQRRRVVRSFEVHGF